MKTFVKDNSVFVAHDDFVNLQESHVVFGSCHDFCVAAGVAMVREIESTRHESFIDVEETDAIKFKTGGKILRVTIEWVEENSRNGCTCGSTDDHHTVACYLGMEEKEAQASK